MTNYAPDCPVSNGIAELTRNKKYVPSSMLYILRKAGVEIEYTGKEDAALDAMGCVHSERKIL